MQVITLEDAKRILCANGPLWHVESFIRKISIQENGCWLWTAFRNNEGYGKFTVHKPPALPSQLAHRTAYAWAFGNLPQLGLDHIVCDDEGCANPFHVIPSEPGPNVLRGENAAAWNARKTHCNAGHPLPLATVIYTGKKVRRCITCSRKAKRECESRRRKNKREHVSL